MQSSPFLLDLQKRTDIDFSKYETTTLINSITDVFASIPKFQMTVILPVLGVIVLDILFLVLKTSHNTASILFFLIVLTVAVIVGGGLGFYFASMNLIKEVDEAASLSIETTQLIYQDLYKTSEKAVNQEFVIPKASEVLKGVVMGLILPTLSKLAIEKAGFLAKGIFWVIEKVFMQILLLLSKFIEDAVEKLPLQNLDKNTSAISDKVNENSQKLQLRLKKLEGIINILGKSKIQINKYSGIGKKLIAIPTLSVVSVYGCISGFLLLILWVFFI